MKDGTEKKSAALAKVEPMKPSRSLAKLATTLAVQANAFDALCTKVDDIKQLTAGEVQLIRRDMGHVRQWIEQTNAALEQVQTLVRDSMALERQRLAKERDLEHQRILRGITATRHSRAQVEVTPEDIAEARRLNAEMAAEAEKRDAEKLIPMSEFKGNPL